MKSRLGVVSVVVLLESLNIIYSTYGAENLDQYYSLTARYSARLTFVLAVMLSIWIVIKSLRNIVQKEGSRNLFIGGICAISINHLIHFYFLFQNFQVMGLELWNGDTAPGALVYPLICSAPLFIWFLKYLNRTRYLLIHFFLVLVLGASAFTYLGRFGQTEPLPLSSPMWLFKLFIVIGGLSLIALVWKMVRGYKAIATKA